jgi:hypothetical protein
MTPSSSSLFHAAQRLDESPLAILNGGASDALDALEAAAPETAAAAEARGIEVAVMNELWSRADARLREVPQGEAVYEAAAEAASLLYMAAWAIGSDSATTEQLREVL